MNHLMRKELMAPIKGAGQAYDAKAKSIQDALVDLIGRNEEANPETMRAVASRMAASPQALMALKAVPAVGALAGLGMKDEEESFANQAMDLLGMGAGMYGINRGANALGGTTAARLKNPLMALGAYGAGALGGNIGVDVLQSAL